MRVDGVLCVQADECEGGVVLRGPQLLFLVCLLREWNGVWVRSEGVDL